MDLLARQQFAQDLWNRFDTDPYPTYTAKDIVAWLEARGHRSEAELLDAAVHEPLRFGQLLLDCFCSGLGTAVLGSTAVPDEKFLPVSSSASDLFEHLDARRERLVARLVSAEARHDIAELKRVSRMLGVVDQLRAGRDELVLLEETA